MKKGEYSINTKIAPKEWSKFKRWHPAACPTDPMGTEERFIFIGGIMPEKKEDGLKKTKRKSRSV